MKKTLLLTIISVTAFITSKSQNFSFNCTRDTVVACGPPCITLKANIPDITSPIGNNYSVNLLSGPGGCFRQYVSPATPGTPTNLTVDDTYTDVVDLGFSFPFFGVTYTQLVVSTNGYVSFDLSNANGTANYSILNNGGTLTAVSGNGYPGQDLPSTLYDRAMIMGPFHDIDPAYTTSPTQQIKYEILGTAPFRRWVLSFYKVPLYNAFGGCDVLIENTHQLVLYESTGIIEVFINDKQICTSWNDGHAMIGLQDFNRTTAVMAPGRKASDPPWGSIGMNESWRFVPTGGVSLFKKVELYDITNTTLLATGTTAGIGNGVLEASFANICPPSNVTTQYLVKSTYSKFDDPTVDIIGLDTLNVLRQNVLPASATFTPSACGASTGTITATANGGVAPYTFILNPGSVTQTSATNSTTFTGLAAGPYTVDVTEGGGCSATVNVVVTNTLTLTGTFVPTATACPGINNGTLVITPDIGPAAGPYTYTLTGPGGPFVQTGVVSGATFSGLQAGTYSVTFANAGGCSGTINNMIVTAGTAPTGSMTKTNTTCPGVNDGTVTITPTAGAAAGPYTVVVTGPGGPYTQTAVPSPIIFTGLATGSYSATFTNAAGCIGNVGPVTIFNGTAPTGTSSFVNTTCPGANDGSITITPNGGAAQGPYNITLNPGGIVQNGVATAATFNALPPNTYTATFTNAAGCTGTVGSILVSNGPAPTGTSSFVNSTCPGANDGSVTITPNGGAAQGPYNITLNPGGIVQNGVATAATFTGLAPNAYTATFTNVFGCPGTVGPVTVSNGPVPTGTFSSTNTTCPGVNDGTVTITPDAGAAQGPYNITLNPGGIVQNGVALSATFAGLAPNTYTATFTNVLGCTGTVGPVTVVAGPAISGTAVPTATTCPTVNDGTITVTPDATAGISVITLTQGAVTIGVSPPSSPSYTFTGLAPGSYSASFVTAAGCTGTIPGPIVVDPGPFLASTFTQYDPPCANINDGTITIVSTGIPGPTPSYDLIGPGGPYGPQISPTFTNLPAGTYTYSFANSTGCTGTGGPVVLTTHSPLAINVSLTEPLCNGNANGIITLEAAGGVADYSYALSPFTTYQPTGVFSGLIAGTYTFRVKDDVGCTKDTTVILGEPTVLTISTATVGTTCLGNDGTITVTGFGGTPAYNYSIDNGVTFQPDPVFTVPPGPYNNIQVQDANGCIASVADTVDLIDNMFLTLGPDSTICQGRSVRFEPVTNPETSIFHWSSYDAPVSTIDSVSIMNATAIPLDTSNYVLHAEMGFCSRTDTVTLFVLRKPLANAGPDQSLCVYTDSTIVTGTATNLSGPIKYLWTPTAHVREDSVAVTWVILDSTQTFYLTVTDDYGKGCDFTDTDSVTIVVKDPVPAFAGNDTIAMTGIPHQLFGSGGSHYLWTPAAPLSNPFSPTPTATLYNDTKFVVQVTDDGGCIAFDTVFIQVYNGPTFLAPNAFSPNGDGLNDVFRAIPVGISNTEWFRVFNRYGELVFETNKWLKGWDGSYQGKRSAPGVYVWMAKGIAKNGNPIEMKGTVLVIQ